MQIYRLGGGIRRTLCLAIVLFFMQLEGDNTSASNKVLAYYASYWNMKMDCSGV